MIRDVWLSAADWNDDDITEPPSRLLNLAVIAGQAYIGVHIGDENGDPAVQLSAIQVSARSLLLALRAALHDDDHPSGAGPGLPSAGRTGELRPAHSHQPWTEDLDTQLRDTWFACTATTPAPIIEEIAEAMGRSTSGIRARLLRIGCDPDRPGSEQSDDRVDPQPAESQDRDEPAESG
ncbi:hypothetical protein [Pseudonocardia abyssalis]|uniref:DNA-binding protein n=2 Tax=Pseudonocardia abyssalis TaxID=2792008 RepID=A0ABS6UZH9_9PSEU|nr:hypothetical protein [Pseudonocardia abyssalis]MBW0114035.1 hypothetical protein [Pseudonocardia abyssalis]MBW0137678.1 hypothetical protein [Pseudonocardia abyssalis]